MNFYFCEKCGKRITESDIAQDARRGENAPGVWCKDCAQAAAPVPTGPPAKTPTPERNEKPIAILETTTVYKMPQSGRNRPATAVVSRSEKSAAPDASATQANKRNKNLTTVQYLFFAGTALLAVVVGYFIIRSDSKPMTQYAATPDPVPTTKLPAQRLPADAGKTPDPKNIVTVPPTPSTPADIEVQASHAYDDMMTKVNAMGAGDVLLKIAAVEAFLKEYENAIVASRARVLLSRLKAMPIPIASLSRPKIPLPGNVPDLVAWFDATDIDGDGVPDAVPANGTKLPAWTDKMTGQTAAQSNAAAQPTLTPNAVNGKTAATFDGVGNVLLLPLKYLPSGDKPCTILVAARSRWQPGGYRWALSYGLGNNGQCRGLGNHNDGRVIVGAWGGDLLAKPAAGDANANGKWDDNETEVITGMFSDAAIKLWTNGVATTPPSFAVHFDTKMKVGYIGKQANDKEPWLGDICEILIYSRALPDAERQAVEQYLMQRWIESKPGGK